MVRVLIFGATGYTGIELIRLLSGHPDVRIVGGTSRDWAGRRASDALPYLSRKQDFPLLSIADMTEKAGEDLAFLALPHGQSALTAETLLEAGLKVIDLSADSRLNDVTVYQKWYGEHQAPNILEKAVYGLPEIHRSLIKKADLVANPGCYPTTVLLGLAPLMNLKELDTDCPIVDSKSGVSGAGRGAKLTTSFCEVGEGFKPYGVLRHRHIPEMEQELTRLGGRTIKVRFTPHLIPVSRGMVSTMYIPMRDDTSGSALREIITGYYEKETFVRVLPAGVYPDTERIKGSNQCHIAVEVDERTGWVIIMSAIDNLVKGASGNAVQNMNLMVGLEETTGLTGLPIFP
ncbi:MAG: N-acetyl-gamma-glutamyl-phosphate reductase [Thermodesulfobacteriota bacterium]|nr:N-acetyl-gamma-glutamyl-phosphate reductase [Thermodesulfobacteriota bacterium]